MASEGGTQGGGMRNVRWRVGAVRLVLVSKPGLLASRASGHVVFAQTKGSANDMGALLRDTLKQFGGKGGGAKDFAQGSVADATRIADAVAHAKKIVAM